MKQSSPADEFRSQFLELCEQMIENTQDMRNYAMKPGNAWLARAELSKITTLTSDLEALIDSIKEADSKDH
jgi:hypothetical protein